MKTANLSPKNNLVPMLVIGLGLFWFFSRRATAGAVVTASTPGATVAQQAADAARNQAIINLSGGLASWLSGLKPSIVTPEGRAAVREGDTYYSSGVTLGPYDNATAEAWRTGDGLGQDTLSNMGLESTADPYNY